MKPERKLRELHSLKKVKISKAYQFGNSLCRTDICIICCMLWWTSAVDDWSQLTPIVYSPPSAPASACSEFSTNPKVTDWLYIWYAHKLSERSRYFAENDVWVSNGKTIWFLELEESWYVHRPICAVLQYWYSLARAIKEGDMNHLLIVFFSSQHYSMQLLLGQVLMLHWTIWLKPKL